MELEGRTQSLQKKQDHSASTKNTQKEDTDFKPEIMDSPVSQQKLKIETDIITGGIKCPHCNQRKKGFASEKALEYHITRSHALNCSVCEKRFRTSIAKLKHEKIVHKGNPNIVSRYNCSLCEPPRRNLGTPWRLIQHMYKKHENHIKDIDKTLVCAKENCGKKFGIEFLYQRHLDVHEIEVRKPFVCQRCEMHFKTEARLEIHSMTHSRYKCKLCDKNFSKKHTFDR